MYVCMYVCVCVCMCACVCVRVRVQSVTKIKGQISEASSPHQT